MRRQNDLIDLIVLALFTGTLWAACIGTLA